MTYSERIKTTDAQSGTYKIFKLQAPGIYARYVLTKCADEDIEKLDDANRVYIMDTEKQRYTDALKIIKKLF